MRVLGIDTALRATGVAVVEASGSCLRPVFHDTIRMASSAALSECLRRIHEGVDGVIERCRPQAAALEGVFFSRNVRTAVVLGEARGAAIAACAGRGVPVYEYPPRRAKQALLGAGSADKEQVSLMVARLLGLAKPLPTDESDAFAIAICHLHSRSPHAALSPHPI